MFPPSHKVHLTERVEWMVRLYDATGNKDQAEEWRTKVAGSEYGSETSRQTVTGLEG